MTRPGPGYGTRAARDDGEEVRLCRGMGWGLQLNFGDGDRKKGSISALRCRPVVLLLPGTCTRRTGAWNNPSRLSGNHHHRRLYVIVSFTSLLPVSNRLPCSLREDVDEFVFDGG